MPPTRRTSSAAAPQGRRPKIAGTGRAVPRRSAEAKPADGGPADVAIPDVAVPDVGVAAARPADAESAVVDLDKQAEAQATGRAAGSAASPASSGGAVDHPDESSPNPVPENSDTTPVDPAEDGSGWRPVVLVGGVALVLAAFAVVAALVLLPAAEVSNRAWVDTDTTTQVTAAARDAIQTLYTYKFDTVDEDFAKARAVLTTDMQSQFDETARLTVDAVKQTKTATNAEVTDIGVKLLGADTAELVASMNVSASNDGVAQGNAEGPLSVTMQKVDGTWLLAGIRDR